MMTAFRADVYMAAMRAKSKRKTKDQHNVNVPFTKSEKQQLSAAAKVEGRSMASLLRVAWRNYRDTIYQAGS